jgi:16S rRNA (guanine527-N7)-methyltransferase
MLDEAQIRKGLEPFGVELNARQTGQVAAYLELLARWSEKINLTSIRSDAERLSRHFGESFYLAKALKLEGSLLDVGSGAGFPALALKIIFPEVRAILLEPIGKKRAFLKEVCRSCELKDVEVRPERIEDYVRVPDRGNVDASTMRSVGGHERVVGLMADCLRTGGYVCLWTTGELASTIVKYEYNIKWVNHLRIISSIDREILIGIKTAQH